MKPFNSEEALSGKLVKLRNGKLARVLVDLSTVEGIKCRDHAFVGVTLADDGYTAASYIWERDGRYGPSDWLDIIGMHEEPTKPQDKILEEAWRNKGKVVKTDAGMITIVEVVGKTADNEYIVRNPCNGSLDEISVYGKLNWKPYEEPKSPVCNPNVVTLHLPKPSKPMQGELYYYIDTSEGKFYVERGKYSHTWLYDRNRREQGNCFASETDAQTWVHALNYARTGEVTIQKDSTQ